MEYIISMLKSKSVSARATATKYNFFKWNPSVELGGVWLYKVNNFEYAHIEGERGEMRETERQLGGRFYRDKILNRDFPWHRDEIVLRLCGCLINKSYFMKP